jgi:hypothetical protein
MTTDGASSPEPGSLTLEERRLLAQREAWRQQKRQQREAKANEHEAAADQPGDFTMPPMPAGLSAIRRWVRSAHDAYERHLITSARLAEARRSAGAVGDLYRVGAELRKAAAAERAAEAQERMASALAAVEHGGPAFLLLIRLQEALSEGRRRPLPGARVMPTMPTGEAS